jgi:RNA polymerase sigma factor (sigma-70 family)
MQKEELIPNLFKSEYSKIIAVLCNLFGIKHIEIAEDIVNDTFLLATETWAQKGIPENPAAWLYTVAKNKTKDYLKRNQNFNGPILAEIKATQPDFEEMEIDLSSQNISDRQLQMLFAVCNPAIPIEAQIGLALRILCGFGIDEIAVAFLSNKETINKRLFRAKEKLREDNIKLELPDPTEINKRMDRVLTTLYLLFNEGYYSKTQSTKLNKELCLEAMRLNYLLIENPSTNTPMANALMSLMCFHSSRFDARISESGESILYDDQDKSLWNEDLIAKGNYFLIESAKGQVVSKYHLEASIAYWHSTKIDSPKKWENILQLYNKLLQIDYSPMAALNRTYALSQANGKLQAIAEAEKLNITESHLYYALLGNLYTEIDSKIARAHYSTAFAMAKTDADKATIAKSLASLKE